MTITWEDFDRVEMRVGRVMEVEVFEEAHRPSFLLKIDFGDEGGVRQSSAAIAGDYQPGEVQGKRVVAVTNFPSKQIANHMSEVLVLAAVNSDGSLRLLEPDEGVELGARIR